MWRSHLLGLIFLVCEGLWAQSTPLIYTASRQGEIEPCGCKTNQIGGLNRMAEKVSQLRKTDAGLFVDAGNTFFSAPEINPNRKGLERLRAELIAKSYQKMKLDFLTPGEKDFALGAEFFFDLVKITGAKLVSANLEAPEGAAPISKYEIWEGNGLKVLVTALSFFDRNPPVGLKVLNPEEALSKILKDFQTESADRVVLLSHLGRAENRKLGAKYPGLLIIEAASLDFNSEPSRAGESFLFESGIEGQRLGLVKLIRERPGFSEARLIEMNEDYDISNPVKKLMDDYYEDLKKNSGQHAGAFADTKSWVAQPGMCKDCHEEQYQFWKGTPHSAAILSLYAKNQHYNPSCVGCHTIEPEIWLKKPNEKKIERILGEVFRGDKAGPLDSRRDPERHKKLHRKYWQAIEAHQNKKELGKNLMGVQCEHCHGSRVEHVQGARTKPQRVSIESCKTCHQPPNAPEFNSDMIKKVSCPLMTKREAEKK